METATTEPVLLLLLVGDLDSLPEPLMVGIGGTVGPLLSSGNHQSIA